MKSIPKLICLIGVAFISLPFMTAAAAPLPAGTKLGITPGVGSGPNLPCASGSCFSMEVAPGFIVWTDFGPGTDGGFIVGKTQKCGTQELGPSVANTTPSELSNAWNFFANFGTFCTDPGGEQNIFDNAGCAGAACIGKTEIKYLYVAWNGNKIPLGSSTGCVLPGCSPDQMAGIFVTNYQINVVTGGAWSMDYKQVVPSGQFLGVKFGMTARGTVTINNNSCPGCMALPVYIAAISGQVVNWTPVISNPNGVPITCRIGTPPTCGTATIASDCSTGTYKACTGFVGITGFTYLFNDGVSDSTPADVTVAVVELSPTPPPIPSTTISVTPTYTAIATPLCTPNPAPYLPPLSTAPGQPVSWDVSQSASNCSVAQPPVYGVVTLTGTCAGVYTPNIGFIGRDQFTYAGIATGGNCPASFTSTITIDVCPAGGCAAPTPTPRPCQADHPVTQLSSLGKQGTLSITFTGNIVSSTNKEIKICPGTALSYTASSTKDVVKCKVKNSLTSGNGTLRIRDHLKCTDKPRGKDKVQFKVKSGVS